MALHKVTITGLDTNTLKTLKSEETIKLLKEYQEGNKELLDVLIRGNLRLVLSSVNKFSKRTDNLDDLFQIGTIGLLKSINNFDLNQEVKFSTYAVPMIEGEIRRYLRDNSFLRISRQIKDLAYRSLKLKEQHLNEFGESLSVEELAQKLEVDQYKIIESLEATNQIISLNEPLYNDFDESLELFDIIPVQANNDDILITRLSLRDGISKLPDFERQIIIRRYYDGKSQVEIANEFHISQAQVSRLEKNALVFLRKFV